MVTTTPKHLSQEWQTPPALFQEVDSVFRLTLDAAATKENRKVENHFSLLRSAFDEDWSGRVWMNPPYGRGIAAWVARAFRQRNNCEVIVGLLPASVDTAWFHSFVYRKAALKFLKGRVAFVLPGHSGRFHAPFPSMLAVWRPDAKKVNEVLVEQMDLFEEGL